MQMFLSEVNSFLYKGILVVHADVPVEAKKIQVGKVEKVLPDGKVHINWDKGAAQGDYPPCELVIYDPY